MQSKNDAKTPDVMLHEVRARLDAWAKQTGALEQSLRQPRIDTRPPKDDGGDTKGHDGPPNLVDYRLVHRMTFGYSEEEGELFRRLGPSGYLEYHLNHEAIPDDYVGFRLAEFATLQRSGAALGQSDWWECVHETVQAHVIRSIYSKRQLYERMVEFWADHFNVYAPKLGKLNTLYQRDVIRRYALTSFPTLLNAVARSSGMLEYLDNASNITGYPNENYARELLELHTLGVDGGYPEDDVLDVARCFTGWLYDWDESSSTYGQFRFDPQYHDNARKYFLGIEIPSNGGIRDGERILEILSGHQRTAKFVSRKLLRHFLTEDPPQALVDRIAAVYMATQGDIKSMLRAILDQKTVRRYATPKFKRPYHFMVSSLRATRAQVPYVFSLWWYYMEKSGQTPFFWPAPNGYPDAYRNWVGNLQPRWMLVQDLVQSWVWQVTVDTFGLLRSRHPQAVVRRIGEVLYGAPVPEPERSLLLTYLGSNPSPDTVREALGLAMAGPTFQWY